ncbi:MAG: adenosylcobinamide-phosphate synthase CbiB [Actinomycetia bacterium]|nr:adenosylcobinamide-phosphate synthase CbiB [Actinomycetes bacterium]
MFLVGATELLFKAVIIVLAFVADCLIGDPQNRFHPMRAIGKGISMGISAYQRLGIKHCAVQFLAGALLWVIVVGIAFGLPWLVLLGLYHLNFWLGLLVEAAVCYFLIAPKALKDESMKVYRLLLNDDLVGARKSLAMIVGRDTAQLDSPGMVRATVETVAENLADGVIAPLIFIFVGGAPLGMAYKAVNTLDSMIGYKNQQFEYFGKFAARLDDLVNLIPARISALLMIIACPLVGLDARAAARTWISDRYKHKSPNSAQTESVAAGALGLSLGGDNYYQGVLVSKPNIGEADHEPTPVHIVRINRLMYAATAIAIALMVVVAVVVTVVRGSGIV